MHATFSFSFGDEVTAACDADQTPHVVTPVRVAAAEERNSRRVRLGDINIIDSLAAEKLRKSVVPM